MSARLPEPGPGAEQVHFGQRLRYWRSAAGLTQAELGRRVAYDHSFISRLERGHRWPTRELAARCDELLGTGGELVSQWRRAAQERRLAHRPPAPAEGGLSALLTALISEPVRDRLPPTDLPDGRFLLLLVAAAEGVSAAGARDVLAGVSTQARYMLDRGAAGG